MRLRLPDVTGMQPEPAAERYETLDTSEMAPEDIRVHSEAPAEGDTSREYPQIRSHSQDPAEGPDAITG
jgi:hypothetical protein